ncbi:uncharacterized protein LOC123545236 isoform X2 [Mercenaria mercenaria]|uniref:uncharacterized protein LOC123545236 isoform X2 n=1 Tax=Mercenaria mercenaria TaxID=6596 RepID=UPI00234E3737|nr:uncharacterized protein LOC123545236 isoform X2 [Mercenaria mercenaria]
MAENRRSERPKADMNYRHLHEYGKGSPLKIVELPSEPQEDVIERSLDENYPASGDHEQSDISGTVSFSLLAEEEEKVRLQKRLALLKEKEKQLQKHKEIEDLRREVEEKEKSVSKLEKHLSPGRSRASTSTTTSDDIQTEQEKKTKHKRGHTSSETKKQSYTKDKELQSLRKDLKMTTASAFAQDLEVCFDASICKFRI